MCDRCSITIDKSTIEYHFNEIFASGPIEFEPNYNAVPSQLLPIITRAGRRRRRRCCGRHGTCGATVTSGMSLAT